MENFIMCPLCCNLIIDVKQKDICFIQYKGEKSSGTIAKLSCPFCGNQNINLNSIDPQCGGVDRKHRWNI